MFNLSSFVHKAQQLLDPMQGLNLSDSDKNPSKATLFQNQFRLPSTQHPLYEINAELTIPPSNATQGGKNDSGFHYAGKLHLSEAYMCFSTTPSSFLSSATTSTSLAFTGQTHGGGPSGNGFTFPLSSIRRVERLHSQNFQVRSPHQPTRPRGFLIADASCSLLWPSRHGTAWHRTRARTRRPIRTIRM
jgi:TBC1 domain family member 8/9